MSATFAAALLAVALFVGGPIKGSVVNPSSVAAYSVFTGLGSPPPSTCSPLPWNYETSRSAYRSFYDNYRRGWNYLWASITVYSCSGAPIGQPGFFRYYQSSIWFSYWTYALYPEVALRTWASVNQCTSGCYFYRSASNEYSFGVLQSLGFPPSPNADNWETWIDLPYNGGWFAAPTIHCC